MIEDTMNKIRGWTMRVFLLMPAIYFINLAFFKVAFIEDAQFVFLFSGFAGVIAEIRFKDGGIPRFITATIGIIYLALYLNLCHQISFFKYFTF